MPEFHDRRTGETSDPTTPRRKARHVPVYCGNTGFENEMRANSRCPECGMGRNHEDFNSTHSLGKYR